MLLAEANMWPEDVRPYFGDGDEFHMAFHFPLMPRMFMALRLEDRKPLVEIVERTPAIPASCQWGLFLRNHDELTLEMVTDAERDYMYDEYARDPVARINLGIRRRLAPLLDGDRRRIELMNALLMSLPGSPVLYYGDEIGMGDNVYLGDRNGVRTPMQWTRRLERRLLERRPRAALPAADLEPGLRLPGGERREPAPRRRTRCSTGRKRLIQVRRSTPRLRPRLDRVPEARRTTACSPTCAASTPSRCWSSTTCRARRRRSSSTCGALAGAIPIEMFGRSLFPRIRERPYVMTLGPYDFFWFRLRWL